MGQPVFNILKRRNVRSNMSQYSFDYATYGPQRVSYTTDFNATVTTKQQYRTYYSILNGTQLCFLDCERAALLYQRYQREHERAIEQYAREHTRYVVPSLYTHRVNPTYTRDSFLNRARARKTYTRLKKLEEHGIQQHVGNIEVKTVRYPIYPTDFSTSHKHPAWTQEEVLGKKNLASLLYGIGRKHDAVERGYSEVFGYHTLEEALEHERYLRILLQSYSIHDIFLWYSSTLPYYTAYMQLYHTFSQRREYFVSVQEGYIKDQAMKDRIREETFPIQRRWMRYLFDDPAILDNAAHAPLEWLMQTKNPANLPSLADDMFREELRKIFS